MKKVVLTTARAFAQAANECGVSDVTTMVRFLARIVASLVAVIGVLSLVGGMILADAGFYSQEYVISISVLMIVSYVVLDRLDAEEKQK